MEEHILSVLPDTPVVTFYFDPISPYAWLAARDIERIEKTGTKVVFQPVLFAALLNAHGQKGPAEIAAKRVYTFRDVMREATRRGLRFKGPPGHPFNPLHALRMCLALTRQDERRRFALAIMDAAWLRGDDLSNVTVLQLIAPECGLGAAKVHSAAQQPAIKAQLAADTEAAIEAGVFGVPTFRYGDELFWGGDRIDALLWQLGGGRIDELVLQRFLARAPLAERKASV